MVLFVASRFSSRDFLLRDFRVSGKSLEADADDVLAAGVDDVLVAEVDDVFVALAVVLVAEADGFFGGRPLLLGELPLSLPF